MLDRTKEVIGKTMLKIFGLRKSLEIYYRIKTNKLSLPTIGLDGLVF